MFFKFRLCMCYKDVLIFLSLFAITEAYGKTVNIKVQSTKAGILKVMTCIVRKCAIRTANYLFIYLF